MWKVFWPGSPFENAHMQVYVLPLQNTLPANLLFWGTHFQTHIISSVEHMFAAPVLQ